MDMHMPRFQITLVLLLALFFQSNSLSFASTELAAVSEIKKGEKQFSADWPAERPPGNSLLVAAFSNCGSGRPPSCFIHWIQNYIESNNLSKHASAEIRLQLKTENWRNWFKLWETGCTPADTFYIQQAVWEASHFADTDGPDMPGKCKLSYKMSAEHFLTPQQLQRKHVVSRYEPLLTGIAKPSRKMTEEELRNRKLRLCSSFSCKTLYFREHPEVTKESAVMHFLPLSAAQCFPSAVEQNELHSLKNLKALEIDKFNSAQLDAFRDEWTKFLKSPVNTVNRQMVLNEADRLAVKYHSLFLD
jgi:hypothetical protein